MSILQFCGFPCAIFLCLKKFMQKVNVPILGLTSNSEARAVRDGECMVLHNLTVEEGGVKVIAPPSEGEVVRSTDYKEYFHDKADRWLSLRGGKVYDDKGNELYGGGVRRVAFMGNLVVMFCGDGTRYALFDGNGYRFLGKLPVLPRLKVKIAPEVVTVMSEGKYYTERAEVQEKDAALRWANASKGFFDECLSGLYRKGAFVDRCIFRLAARLFDGSYVAFSPLYYVEDGDDMQKVVVDGWTGGVYSVGRDNANFVSWPQSGGGRSRYYASVRGFVPSFELVGTLSQWKDVILSVDLFASASVMGHEVVVPGSDEVRKGSVVVNVANGYERFVRRSAEKVREEVADVSMFYKVTEFDLEGNEVWRLENTAPSQLAVQTALPVDEMPHGLSGGYDYVYNKKLHVAGVTEWLADASQFVGRAARTDAEVVQLSLVATVATEQGERKVVSNYRGAALTKAGDDFFLSPLLMYPDARAVNLRVFVGYLDRFKSAVVRYRDFPLKAHRSRNCALFLSDVVPGTEQGVVVSWSAQAAVAVSVPKFDGRSVFLTMLPLFFGEGVEDFAGTYLFTCTGHKWSLSYTLRGGVKVDAGVVRLADFGIDFFVDGVQVNENEWLLGEADYSAVEDGATITVVVNEESGEIAGIAPIKVGDDGWSSVENGREVNVLFEGDEFVGFNLIKDVDKRVYSRGGVMRVSEVDNPMFFPARFTYSFDEDIVAVCSNTLAVSQGQFGQHPLYVFTKGGVWLMSVDASGAGSYLSQVPCSREICSGAEGVAAVPGGVVFPTAMGLLLLSGAETVELSKSVGGVDTPELAAGGVVGDICSLVGKGDFAARVPFAVYLRGAFTAFDFNTGLLWVCNGGHDYAWVYNMASGAWSTADGCFSGRVDCSGMMVLGGRVYDGGYLFYRRCTFSGFDASVGDVPVVMVSRGCIFGETGFKRVAEAALRGTVFSNRSCFYVLGSVDGVQWSVVCGKERLSEEAELLRDFVTHFKRSRSYRFVSFAFVGVVRSDARLLMCEIGVEAAWGNRLR